MITWNNSNTLKIFINTRIKKIKNEIKNAQKKVIDKKIQLEKNGTHS